jgi:chaperonin cofactor prefoldin
MALPAALLDRGLQKQIENLEERVRLLETQNTMQQTAIRELEEKLKALLKNNI